MRLLRRLRGALGMSLWWTVIWGVVGGVLSAALAAGMGLGTPESGPVLRPTLFFIGVYWAIQGFIAGLVFSLLLTALERHRTFTQLSARRISILGAIGGAVLPTITGLSSIVVAARVPMYLPLGLAIGAIGGGLAAYSSLALARRARAIEGGSDPSLLGEGLPDLDAVALRSGQRPST